MIRKHHRRGGFTLLEMMMVVAIIGIMSALAGSGIQSLVAQGKVNGTAGAFTRMFADARLRALTMTCRTSVQINGPNYAPGSPPAGSVTIQNVAWVFMKGNCSSPNGWFEPGDRVIAQFNIEKGVQQDYPTTLITGGLLDTDAVVLSWGLVTNSLLREVWVDAGGAGFNPVAAQPSIDISMTVKNNVAARHSVVPDKGAPFMDM